MRGKGFLPLDLKTEFRITPAYAGKSCDMRAIVSRSSGSPPPMRGKEWNAGGGMVRSGITPAYAGKREAQHAAEDVNGDHPRLCGEKLCERSGTDCNAGSPPPMRGKVTCVSTWFSVPGITPAYAGKSFRENLCIH